MTGRTLYDKIWDAHVVADGGEGVLIELVQAPPEVIAALG
jgi:hypothetical protein